MTHDDRVVDDGPATRAEFEARVRALLVAAHSNGVELRNGLDVWNDDPELPSWTVEITEVEDYRTEVED